MASCQGELTAWGWGVSRVRRANHPTVLIWQRGLKGGALHTGEGRADKD